MTAMLSRARSWNAVMTATPGECDISIPAASVRGTIPAALRGGRHLQNGPGWTKIGDRLAHPFDGHGLVRSLTFTQGGGAELRSRFVHTPAYDAERAAGRLVYRGLGTNPTESMWKNLFAPAPRNVANTTIVPWAGRLLCGWEGGRPYALDSQSLATLGEETFGDSLPNGAFLAHMRLDSVADRLVGCSIRMGMPSRFTFREYDREGSEVASCEASVPGMHFVHDFVVTPRWYVLPGNALKVDALGFCLCERGAQDADRCDRAGPVATGCVVSDSARSTRAGANDRVAATRVRRALRQRLRRRCRDVRRRSVRVRIVRVRQRVRLPGRDASAGSGAARYPRTATSVQSNDQRPLRRSRVAAAVRLRSRLSARASAAGGSRGAGDLCIDAQRPHEVRSVRCDRACRCARTPNVRRRSGRQPSISSSANRCSRHGRTQPMPTTAG